MRGWSICLFINLFVCFNVQSQQTAQTIPVLTTDTLQRKLSNPLFFTSKIIQTTTSANAVKTIPASFYTNNLPFFCKKELQLEKLVKFPIKMRVGSVEYTDRLEGKRQ